MDKRQSLGIAGEDLACEELRRRGIQYLPTTLQEALQCMQDDAVVRAALGEDYAAYYIRVKQDEWDRYHRSISPWETENYLGVY